MANHFIALLRLRFRLLYKNIFFLGTYMSPLLIIYLAYSLDILPSQVFLSFALTIMLLVTVGPSVSILVAKETYVITSLRLAGISKFSYLISICLFPILYLLIITNIIIHTTGQEATDSNMPIVLTSLITGIIMCLIHLLIALLAKNQMHTQIYSSCLLILLLVTPMLSNYNDTFKFLNYLSPLYVLNELLAHGQIDLLGNFVILFIWILALFIACYILLIQLFREDINP